MRMKYETRGYLTFVWNQLLDAFVGQWKVVLEYLIEVMVWYFIDNTLKDMATCIFVLLILVFLQLT
jgi:hypothetical protein